MKNLKPEASKNPYRISCNTFKEMYKKNLEHEYQKLKKK